MARGDITYAQAINEALDQCLAEDPSVYLVGLGVPDVKGVFGTTLGLQEKHGADRVQDMPISENGITGIAIGAAITGMRPIITHQRLDFALLAMEQMVNQAAKWHYMFGGKASVPMVVRMIIGRGWGQGPQHSQSLQAWFAHVPGLKVVMPATPHDAKGLLIASVRDPDPVIFLEHRWLHYVAGPVPEAPYEAPLGRARVTRNGSDLTIVGTSYMALEALRAAGFLAADGIQAEVIDLRTIQPWDVATVLASVRKTGRLIVTDTGWRSFGVAGDIVATVAEQAFSALKVAPRRVTLPDGPTPTTPELSRYYYPRAVDIVDEARALLGLGPKPELRELEKDMRFDIPDPAFTGPF